MVILALNGLTIPVPLARIAVVDYLLLLIVVFRCLEYVLKWSTTCGKTGRCCRFPTSSLDVLRFGLLRFLRENISTHQIDHDLDILDHLDPLDHVDHVDHLHLNHTVVLR